MDKYYLPTQRYPSSFLWVWLTTLLLPLALTRVTATDYYVSTSEGQPTNTGLMAASPKKTFAQLQTIPNFGRPGDRIFFKRGDVFREKITLYMPGATPDNPIQLLAYGPGQAYPVLSGADEFSGNWQYHAGSGNQTIWKKTVGTAKKITQLYLDGQRLIPARWPNQGSWARTTSSHPWGCSFTSTSPFTGGGDFNGATLRARVNNYVYDVKVINISDPAQNTIGRPNDPASLTNPYPDEFFSTRRDEITGELWAANQAGQGFYVDNKLNLLDAPKEWFFDPTAGVLYLMSGQSTPPNNQLIEGFVRREALEVPWGNIQNIIIDGLEIRHTQHMGVYIANNANNKNITVQNCYIHDHEGYTLGNFSPEGFLLQNCRVENGYWSAVSLGTGTARNNRFKRNCMIEGYGENNFGYNTLDAKEAYDNVIDSSGYGALGISTNGIAHRNLVTNACLILNDGGAISIAWESGNQVFENNVVINVPGNAFTNGPANQSLIANGMYFGGKGNHDIIFRNNTILNTPNGLGISMLDTYTSQVTGNLVYGAGTALMHYNSESATPQSYDNTITDNTFIVDKPNKYSILIRSDYSHMDQIGTFDRNYYWQPYSRVIAELNYKPSGFESIYYSMSSWQEAYPDRDANTKLSDQRLTGYRVSGLGPELIPNGTFNSNVDGWQGLNGSLRWDQGSTEPASLLAGGGVLAGQGNNAYDLAFTASNFTALSAGKRYLLRFKHLTQPGRYLTGRTKIQKTTPYDVLAPGNLFVSEPQVNNEEMVLTNTNTQVGYPVGDARLGIELRASGSSAQIWVDSVSLREVTAGSPDPLTNHLRVFVNTSQQTQSYSLASDSLWRSLDGQSQSGTISLEPFTSMALTKSFLAERLVYTVQDGLWNNPSIWSCTCIPSQTDSVEIRHLVNLPINYTANAHTVTLKNSSKLRFGSNSKLNLR